MKKRVIPILFAGICFITAICIILYPIISSYINDKYRSEILTSYEEQIELTDASQLKEIMERAISYNQAIIPGATDAYNKDAILAASESYERQLNIAGNGIMAYIDIPKINVNLPVYHNTDDETLDRGIGHLLGSSLPVGGENTHAVLSGHSGMASQKMFSDLQRLEQGDLFYIHVLNEVLAYRVTEQFTVLPYDTSHLGVIQGKDLCTLVTCVPIGINSHRLLIRGERTAYTEANEETAEVQQNVEPAPSAWVEQYKLGILIGSWSAAAISLVALIWKQCKRLRYNTKSKASKKGGHYLRKGKHTPLLRSLQQYYFYPGQWL